MGEGVGMVQGWLLKCSPGIHYKSAWWLLLAGMVLLLDYSAKFWVLQELIIEQPIQLTPWFNLLLTFNFGAAFSFLNHAGGWQEWLFVGIAIGVSVVIVIWQLKIIPRAWWLQSALALILGGTLGNLLDRLRYHAVVDFLDFHWGLWHYPTFNFADVAISLGAVMLAIAIMGSSNSKQATSNNR